MARVSPASLGEALAAWRSGSEAEPAFAADLERAGALDRPPGPIHGPVIDTSEKIGALLARVPLVEFGREIAECWGALFALLSQRGAFGVVVGPRDQEHFRRIPRLRVEVLPAA